MTNVAGSGICFGGSVGSVGVFGGGTSKIVCRGVGDGVSPDPGQPDQ